MTAVGVDWSQVGMSAAVAALPMYDFLELQAANDALWSALCNRLADAGVECAPARLNRGANLDRLWTDPNLMLAQTCGYPFMTRLRGRVRLVLTPRYRARGCDGPFHRSVVVVRKGERAQGLADLRGLRLALNGPDSNTGMNLLRAEIAPIARTAAFFGAVISTGSHAASAAAVAEGQADVAAIDCITWAHLQRLQSELTERLSVLAWTARSPGLPLITGRLTDRATFEALTAALNDLARDEALAPVRHTLLLEGFHPLPEPHYRSLLYFEQMAESLGYPALR